MKAQDLTPEQRQLLATDFGEFDKIAAEQVKFAGDLYAAGQSLADQAADAMEKAAAEAAEKEKEDDEEEDGEKTAAARDNGNIVAEGFIDKLASLGSERYNDPMAYFRPLMEEKVAQAGARAAVAKFRSALTGAAEKAMGKAKDVGSKAKDLGSKAKGSFVDYHKGIGEHFRRAAQGTESTTGMKANKALAGMTGKERAAEAAKGVGKLAPHAAGIGALGYLATRKKKES